MNQIKSPYSSTNALFGIRPERVSRHNKKYTKRYADNRQKNQNWRKYNGLNSTKGALQGKRN